MSRSPSKTSTRPTKSRDSEDPKSISDRPRVKSSKSLSAFSIVKSENAKNTNPFTLPSDNDIFMLRDKERQKKKEHRTQQRKLKVHEKTTYTSQVNAKTAEMRKIGQPSDDEVEEEEKKDKDGAIAVKDDPQFTLAITRDRHVEKENLADFIAKKREMFLVQYSLGVKRDEMRKLEEIAQAEEKKLELAEQYLEEDAAMFDEFLKENDKNSVEAIKIAEAETKLKLEKVAEIKKINAQMMLIKSEISKNEDTMKEYVLYQQFLDSLTPKEWKDEKNKIKEDKRKSKQKNKTVTVKKKGSLVLSDRTSSRASRKESRLGIAQKGASPPQGARRQKSDIDGESQTSSAQETDDEDSEEEPELFFTDPQQLLDIFSELEEQNLSLIQNSQETEEALEELKQTIKQTQDRMNHETEILKGQIDFLKDAIKREEERAAELEMKSKMFSYGEFKAEDQEKMLAALNKKVEEVYRNCIGDNEANISTLQMLTNIENRLEELFEQIEIMPADRVEMAEKAKEKERRLRVREEKMEQQRLHQEDRVRRALERAQAEPKKKTGKPLMFRSEPPQTRKKQHDADKKQDKEEEELKYFFT
ncbi:Coiled-coil domain-containing protein 37 [Exaiptasia diaphana]|nr:Coiled-coil domain-containing protein 37 [Exaiptasia diaphana]